MSTLSYLDDIGQRPGRKRGRPRTNLEAPISDTDVANAKRLATRHGRNLRFASECGWLVYDGRRFAADPKGVRVTALAKETALSIFDEVKGAADRDAVYSHARRSQSKTSIQAMEFLARSEPGVHVRLTDFDVDPWVLNVANGTIDLRTGVLRPHRQGDHISKVAPVEFDPAASCETWDAFVWRVTDRNEELYGYLRRLAGYLLTGVTTEQVLHFLWGNGANGKSVFCEVILELLGEYATVAAPDLITMRRHGGIPNDIARLRGVRVAMMNETTQGSRFDEARLKDLTGGDKLTGRFLHAEYFDFPPTHKLVIRGNHKPGITGTDDGIWRRLRLVPFTVTIPPEERDPNLLSKLRAELSGILAWSVQGCLEWQRDGLRPPAVVLEAASQYRDEADVLGRFIAECCTVRKLGQVKASEFQKAYAEYCRATDERAIPSKDLPTELERRGFTYQRRKTARLYLGLELVPPPDARYGSDDPEDGYEARI
jgi:putative DNA primase/helicase